MQHIAIGSISIPPSLRLSSIRGEVEYFGAMVCVAEKGSCFFLQVPLRKEGSRLSQIVKRERVMGNIYTAGFWGGKGQALAHTYKGCFKISDEFNCIGPLVFTLPINMFRELNTHSHWHTLLLVLVICNCQIYALDWTFRVSLQVLIFSILSMIKMNL